jgi:hypothetical protein
LRNDPQHQQEKRHDASDEQRLANRELSIEELDAIAAGGWFSSAIHWVGHEASSIGHGISAANSWAGSEVRSIGKNPVVASMAGTLVIGGGIALALA